MTALANGALDIRLLRTLHLLLSEGSVSRTAEILGQTQPTVSLALKRLRELLGDPLLVRAGSALVPTERGVELRASVGLILQDIETHLAPHPGFDPRTTERHFRIAAGNCLGTVFLPRLVRELRAQAPRATVEICPVTAQDALSRLATGAIDLVVGNWPNPPSHLRTAPLLSTDIVCLVNARHHLAPRRERLTLAEYLRESHLSPTSSDQAALSPIDGRLLALGLKRAIAVTVPEYAIVPYVLAQTDLVFTTGRPFAEQLAQMMPFAVLEAPPEFGPMEFYLLWHECRHHSAAHAWLRRLLRQIAAQLRSLDGSGLAALPPREGVERGAGEGNPRGERGRSRSYA